MSDPKLTAPLAEFKGQKPPAPQWFSHAIARQPERGFTEVEGAAVETLTWGKPRQARALVPARRRRACRLVVVHSAVLCGQVSRRGADLHRHGALGPARGLSFSAVRARGAGGGARRRRIRWGAAGRRRPFVRRARFDGPGARVRTRVRRRRPRRSPPLCPGKRSPAEPAATVEEAPASRLARVARRALLPGAAAALRKPVRPRLSRPAVGARSCRRSRASRLGALIRPRLLGPFRTRRHRAAARRRALRDRLDPRRRVRSSSLRRTPRI